ncbi:UPF0149 family protein [Herbaspirillum sp. RTI4]|uniref:UPF0149 family protein n=1 Tax=Herbaspirillum sp. RTI4 TaxID=3048640 RepID=UPI002AB36075|nr:UPF0149 family protein [Herbaspirillum sp. RTI4]MDY7577149.1 UPF0149 family protein [Herbaspirillum sp. RTI4]MEA9980439.1 UPF0149 family protein [Herbaspirillum sp. RTI4]
MSYSNTPQALSNDEFTQLAEFLDDIGPPALNLESLDGYFAALICGPETVPPSEYLTGVWGPDFAFSSNEQASTIQDLLLRHWSAIESALHSARDGADVPYSPVLLVAADGVIHGNDWASGFMRGTRTRPASWRPLFEIDEFGGPLLPMLILMHEHNPDPALRPNPIAPDKRDKLLQTMVTGLVRAYRYFAPQRQRGNHVLPKVGRNDVCPCGSGKKSKHCCGAPMQTLH